MGQSVLSPPIAKQLLGQVRKPSHGALSERELEIVLLVARGATNKKVASELFISEAVAVVV